MCEQIGARRPARAANRNRASRVAREERQHPHLAPLADAAHMVALVHGRPAAFRMERHAVRQDVMDFVGSICLLRPCHGNTQWSGSLKPSCAARSRSSWSTSRHVAFNVGDRHPAGVFDRRTCNRRLVVSMSRHRRPLISQARRPQGRQGIDATVLFDGLLLIGVHGWSFLSALARDVGLIGR